MSVGRALALHDDVDPNPHFDFANLGETLLRLAAAFIPTTSLELHHC